VRRISTPVRLAAAVAAAVAALGAGPAWAASGGYGPSGPPPSSAPGGFSRILLAETVGSSGASIHVPIKDANLFVSIPPLDFSFPVEVALYEPTAPPVSDSVVGFRIVFFSPQGSLNTNVPFRQAITITVQSPSISLDDVVEIWTGSSFVRYPDATVSPGEVLITITTDPTFVVVPAAVGASPTASPPPASSPPAAPQAGSTVAAVPGATSVQTGEPFLGAGLGAAAAAALGAGALVVRRRRAALRRG
jgi:hypothetical protein